MANSFASSYSSVTMPGASYTTSRKKRTKTLAICLAPLLCFFALDIILALIFGSFETNPTRTQGMISNMYEHIIYGTVFFKYWNWIVTTFSEFLAFAIDSFSICSSNSNEHDSNSFSMCLQFLI